MLLLAFYFLYDSFEMEWVISIVVVLCWHAHFLSLNKVCRHNVKDWTWTSSIWSENKLSTENNVSKGLGVRVWLIYWTKQYKVQSFCLVNSVSVVHFHWNKFINNLKEEEKKLVDFIHVNGFWKTVSTTLHTLLWDGPTMPLFSG